MLRILSILFLGLILSGCGNSSFSIFGRKDDKGMVMPTKPQKNLSDIETLRSGIGVITDISHIAHTSGVNAHTHTSKVLLDTAKTIQTVAGLPIDHIDWKDAKAVEKMNKKIIADEKRYRQERAEWEAAVTSKDKEHKYLIDKNNSLSNSLNTWKNRFYFGLVIFVILCFLFPGIFIPLGVKLIGRAKKTVEVAGEQALTSFKGQFGQVVEAIEEYKKDDPEQAKKLLEKLQKKTDSHTRQSINELKQK